MTDKVEEFREKLVGAGVDKECVSPQVDFEATFLRPLHGRARNPYAEYSWEVRPYPTVVRGKVIHAVPPRSQFDRLPWEEWFLWEGAPRHHVFYTSRRTQQDIEFGGALDDKHHPLAVLGRKWYYENDPDLSPVLFR